MTVTPFTWIVSIAGLLIMGLLFALQFVALLRPRGEWTLKNVYGSTPIGTDPRAYFAFNQGLAWGDVVFWGPIQIAGSVGMLLGQRWGFLLALMGSVPFMYTAITLFVWDRDMEFRRKSFEYWVVAWMFPVFGLVEAVYCFARLTGT